MNLKISFKSFLRSLFRLKKIHIIFATYTSVILLGAAFLVAPFSHSTLANKISFFTSLFTAVSAFSDTGLSLVDTATNFNVFGQSVIAILIILGGIGIFAVKFYIFNNLFGKKISILSREILKIERGSSKLNDLKGVIKTSINLFLILVLLSSLALTLHFYFYEVDPLKFSFEKSPYKDVSLSLRYGIFHSISAINNAGFDIIGASSFAPYYYSYFLQIIIIILTIIGGIGYPVIYDFYCFFRIKLSRQKVQNFRFSLFSKISLLSYFVISFFGFILFIAFEASSTSNLTFWNQQQNGNWFAKTFALFFHNFMARSTGFLTFDLKQLSQASIFLTSLLMFIGSSPSSTGGGIRVTTFWIFILVIISKIKGSQDVNAFKRKIKTDKIVSAAIVCFISLALVISLVFLASFSLDNSINQGNTIPYQIHHLIFEVTSAFGTSGLSTGLIRHLSTVSQIGFMLVMLIGQLGITSFIYVWQGDNIGKQSKTYITEDILIG
ncbi:TrkH family potassium uptake protein [Mycoplasma flocculare]|uniref:Potassium transporter KtrB n=1 Tax=Mesomycoplasma flocculare ATCC 27399 TaxID=743971 RepID=A0A0A8E6S1_MESFC|nr:potassium transporter TrkG [Mesomycoplasma flocculare]MXR39320.1 TrkH family potassium uptake protein [Mycoplasma sp. MF12]AJC49693.1 potassium transporter KtrB [Mesomycoplasma flocculare ATCC 27399]ENX51084.1 potassium uptake protein [Mesomycoplasma flocculare ATCC 27716]MXR05734.1 TrkH family potassium uptake protein [Mesomycoplasma flocculare]MXR12105.1 TrkH family potassium uptake protein [Mesomycoplasma flocculare]